jgi:hypothetical protein
MAADPRFQQVDLYKPIQSSRAGAPPMVIRVAVEKQNEMTVMGPTTSSLRPEAYVLLSALPEELRRRVELAIQSIAQGM